MACQAISRPSERVAILISREHGAPAREPLSISGPCAPRRRPPHGGLSHARTGRKAVSMPDPDEETQELGPKEPHGTDESEVDWKSESRKWESRAKENKDAADELARIKEANATELEKAQARAKKAEDRLATYESDRKHQALVRKVMEEQHVDARYAPLLTAPDEEGLASQAKLVAERFAEPVGSDTGRQPATGDDVMARCAHDLFTGKRD